MPWLDETSSDLWSEKEAVNAYLMPVDDLVGSQELDGENSNAVGELKLNGVSQGELKQ